MNKKEILKKVIDEIEKEIRGLKRSIGGIHDAAVEAPSAMESHSDTTKSQMQGLEAKASEDLSSKERELKTLRRFVPNDAGERIEIGSLFEIEEKGKKSIFFFLEGGAGIKIAVKEGPEVLCAVITPRAPLGRAFLGKKKGEKVIMELPAGRREYTITDIL